MEDCAAHIADFPNHPAHLFPEFRVLGLALSLFLLLGGKGLTLGLRLLRAGLQRFQVPVLIVYHFPLSAQNFYQLTAV